MSQAQIKKATEEKQQLEAELESVKQASPPEEAADELISYMQNTKEPLADPENEWRREIGGKACCSIM